METTRNIKLSSHLLAKKHEGIVGLEKELIEENSEFKVKRKKWGSETIIKRNPYGCKIMSLEPGTRCSNHFHANKQETFVLIQGQMSIELTDLNNGRKRTVTLKKPFSSITINPYVPHEFYAPNNQKEPTIFIEASTQDTDYDNYRFTESQDKALNNR
jgi:mannose-6-phosphate isomerase-like protein (cupin superfamily)